MNALVLDQRRLGPALRWLTLSAPELASAQPGQFVMLRCAGPGSDDPFLRRPFFVADADARAGTLSLFYSLAGRGTHWLESAAAGTRLDLLGPLGRPLSLAGRAGHLLLIAEGWAVAPLLFLAQRSAGSSMLLLHRAGKRVLELPPFLLPPEVEYLTVSDSLEQTLDRPLVESGLSPLQWSDTVVAAGGPPLALELAGLVRTRRLRRRSGQARFILADALPCGIGLCGGCRVESLRTKGGPQLLCLDGPAFNLEQFI